MAMELFVLSDKQLNSMAEWQAAVDSEGYPLRFDESTPIAALKGFLPATLRGVETGFECSHWQAERFMPEISRVNFGHDWKYLLAFRWGGDFNQLQSAWMAAVAYAKATGGIIFNDEEGKIHTATEARDIVQEIERGMPTVEAILRQFDQS
jgi:hypothetical protein